MQYTLDADEQKILASLIMHPTFQKAQLYLSHNYLDSLSLTADGQLNPDSQIANQSKGFAKYAKDLRNMALPAKVNQPVEARYTTPPEGAVSIDKERLERDSPA